MTESFNSKFTESSILFTLPWHKKKYPSPDDVVIGYIKKIEEHGIVVNILDYLSMEAMMPLQELSRKKVSSIRSLFKEGDIRPLLVLRVDEEKGFIDLSNKYINMAQDEIVRFDKYSCAIRIFYQWINYLTNKNDPTYKLKVESNSWSDIMNKSVWLYSQGEIYDKLLDIKTGVLDIQQVFKINDIFCDKDLLKLKKIIDESISYNIELNLSLSLVSWSINAIEKIRLILESIQEKCGDNCVLVKTTAPNYEFIIKSNSKNELTSLNDTIKDYLCREVLDRYQDIKYNLVVKLSESS
jgi:translation initiation factor 2 alpha subunit (eIF-2alpha)